MKAEQLIRFAKRLELNVATKGLIENNFPNHQDGEDAGRYTFVHSAIENQPDLINLMLSEDFSLQRSAQQRLFENLPTDIAFLHGLAVMFREEAINIMKSGRCDERLETVSVALWGIVLSSRVFWDDFCGRRHNLDAAKQDDLLERVCGSILIPHNTQGGQDYAAKRYDSSRVHLMCTNLWRKTPQAFVEQLNKFNLFFPTEANTLPFLDFDETKTGIMNRTASGLLDDFTASLVEEANQLVEQGLDYLPAGIRKNYDAAIKHLLPFLGFDIGESRISHATLCYYSEWCGDLYVNKDFVEAQKLVAQAGPVVDRLASISSKGQGYLPENIILSRHYLLRGFYADDEDTQIQQYRIALEWDPTNVHAENLLNERLAARILKQAYEELNSGNHSAVLRELDKAESQNSESTLVDSSKEAILSEINRTRFQVHIVRAFGHAKSYLFDDAANDLKQAMDFAYHPDDQVEGRKSFSMIMALQAVFWVKSYPYDSNARREAKKQLEEALEIDPGNDFARENLGRI